MAPSEASSHEGVDGSIELLLARVDSRREAILQALAGLSGSAARQRPRGTSRSLLDIVRHLTDLERNWMGLDPTGALEQLDHRPRSERDSDADADAVVARYRARAAMTDVEARQLALDAPTPEHPQVTIRWALLCLLQETARSAGRAEVVRELILQPMGELEPE
jgi:hypothetical protein